MLLNKRHNGACCDMNTMAYNICQSEQKRFQHLPKGSKCDCRITKRSG